MVWWMLPGKLLTYRFFFKLITESSMYILCHHVLKIQPILNLQGWIENYKGKFEKLFAEKYMLGECRLSPYFDRSFIQYYAIHAYGENIPALYESVTSSNFITYNYNSFLTVLKKNIPAWEVISLEEEQANEKQANEHYRKGVELYYKNNFEKAD